MKNALFNVIKSANPRRNIFDASHQRLLSGNVAGIYPIFFSEVIPSDSIRLKSELLLRFHPMLAPIMSRFNAYVHFFYVPYRMVWNNFEKFLTGGEDGLFTAPHPNIIVNESRRTDLTKGRLGDYLGIPPLGETAITGSNEFSALPFRAYALIYNEYYRDQNLEAPIAFTKDDVVAGAEQTEITTLRTRAYAKDYFTSALTDTQKGGQVLLPYDIQYKRPATSSDIPATPEPLTVMDSTGNINLGIAGGSTAIENIESLGISINDLRASSRLQEWLERNARSGSRMAEFLLSHFSVKSDDLRLNRPRYEGGGKTAISISEVLSNWQSDTVPQGEMAGHGIGVGTSNTFKAFYKEYGCVIGLLSVMPEHILMNGIPRQFIKNDKFDYCHPIFANLGEQPVYNQEVFFNPNETPTVNNGAWGYQSRYSEYKSGINTVHGDFRDSLAFWHVGRNFAGLPNLNASFIKVNSAELENQIFAVDDSGASNKWYAMVYNDFKAVRPLPIFGTPRL